MHTYIHNTHIRTYNTLVALVFIIALEFIRDYCQFYEDGGQYINANLMQYYFLNSLQHIINNISKLT